MWFCKYKKLYEATLLELWKERCKAQYWHDKFMALSFKKKVE